MWFREHCSIGMITKAKPYDILIIMYNPIMIGPSGAKTEILWDNSNDSMADDTLTPYVTMQLVIGNFLIGNLVIIMEIWYPSQYKDYLFWIFFILKKRRSWGRPILFLPTLLCHSCCVKTLLLWWVFTKKKKRQQKLMNHSQRNVV